MSFGTVKLPAVEKLSRNPCGTGFRPVGFRGLQIGSGQRTKGTPGRKGHLAREGRSLSALPVGRAGEVWLTRQTGVAVRKEVRNDTGAQELSQNSLSRPFFAVCGDTRADSVKWVSARRGENAEEP